LDLDPDIYLSFVLILLLNLSFLNPSSPSPSFSISFFFSSHVGANYNPSNTNSAFSRVEKNLKKHNDDDQTLTNIIRDCFSHPVMCARWSSSQHDQLAARYRIDCWTGALSCIVSVVFSMKVT